MSRVPKGDSFGSQETRAQQIEIEKVKTVLHDDYGHKVPLAVSTTTTEGKMPKMNEDWLRFKVLEYLYDVKQAYVSDIAKYLQKKNNTVSKTISRLRKLGFIRTGLDWRVKITSAGIEYIYIYKDNGTIRHTTAHSDTKNLGSKPKKQNQKQLNFDSWIKERPYLSSEAVLLADVLIKNYHLNGVKAISGQTFGDFENNLRMMWVHFNKEMLFPGEDDLQQRIHELRTSGFITLWNKGCYKIQIMEKAFQSMAMGVKT
jgi:DNA-binding MarR family transcriptional regulator